MPSKDCKKNHKICRQVLAFSREPLYIVYKETVKKETSFDKTLLTRRLLMESNEIVFLILALVLVYAAFDSRKYRHQQDDDL